MTRHLPSGYWWQFRFCGQNLAKNTMLHVCSTDHHRLENGEKACSKAAVKIGEKSCFSPGIVYIENSIDDIDSGDATNSAEVQDFALLEFENP